MSSFVNSEWSRYRGCAIAVGTKHGKERQLAPAFSEVLGARLVVPLDVDTDQFGTFCGDVARVAPAIDTARAKARLGMGATGLRRGLASEASYRPLTGLGCAVHEEILLFVDDVDGMEVLEGHRAATPFPTSCAVATIADLPTSMIASLPEQAVIVRPSTQGGGSRPVKGITDLSALRNEIAAAAKCAPDGRAVVEPDLRAHHNPSRRQVLTRLGYRLAHRLATLCPSCHTPGYGRVGVISGLPCRSCWSPTELPMEEDHACAVCPHHSTVRVATWADPRLCPACNP